MKKFFIILLLQCSTITFAQEIENNALIYEQIALNFFIDSLLNKKEPFFKTKVYFNGEVDSSITLLGGSCILNKYYQENQIDKELEHYLILEGKANNEFFRINKKPSFFLEVKKPIRKHFIRFFALRRSASVMKIFQNKSLGNKNYIWFRLFSKDGLYGNDLYFTINNEGEVLNWCFQSFIF